MASLPRRIEETNAMCAHMKSASTSPEALWARSSRAGMRLARDDPSRSPPAIEGLLWSIICFPYRCAGRSPAGSSCIRRRRIDVDRRSGCACFSASTQSYRGARPGVLTCIKTAVGNAATMPLKPLPTRRPRRKAKEPTMFQIRLHGRGGQGVVSGAEMLSVAAFLEGKYAQAFPTFGSERMGAPVVSFCRIDDHAIRVREPVAEPDAIVVQDPTLLRAVPVLDGCRPGGYALVNSARRPDELALSNGSTHLASVRWICLPATEIARRHLGRPLPNVPLL